MITRSRARSDLAELQTTTLGKPSDNLRVGRVQKPSPAPEPLSVEGIDKIAKEIHAISLARANKIHEWSVHVKCMAGGALLSFFSNAGLSSRFSLSCPLEHLVFGQNVGNGHPAGVSHDYLSAGATHVPCPNECHLVLWHTASSSPILGHNVSFSSSSRRGRVTGPYVNVVITEKLRTEKAEDEQDAVADLEANVIDLTESTDSDANVIDLTGSADSSMEASSSDRSDGDESSVSEDEDGDETNISSEEREIEKPLPSTAWGELLAEEVIKRIRGGDLNKLKVDDCRSYLRNYGLRVTGTKAVLVDRIKQHISLKEGGARNYDRSTFTINCTGDVCTGDVVKFDQKVYEKHNNVASQKGALVGSRTVVGRVVKESYGAQRQQHTFTVEVFWSTGCTPLAPMKQLLVKGRNLYKRRTFRQRWADEGERRQILDEKHERGAAARQVRAVKRGRIFGGPVVQQKVAIAIQKQLVNPYPSTLNPEGYNDLISRDLNRPSSSHHNKSSYCNRQKSPYHGRPMSPHCDKPSALFPNLPSQPLSGQGRVARILLPTANNLVAPVGSHFLCPERLCANLGSRLCSRGVCYYCCKRKGGKCSNPKHRPAR